MSRYKLQLLFVLISLVTFSGFAQDGGGVGELEDEVVTIVKDAKITLPTASRNYGKVPPQPVSVKKDTVRYSVREISYLPPSVSTRIRPLRSKGVPPEKLYGSLIRAGYGNYSSPLLDVYLNNKRNKKYNYGLSFNHLSSGKGPVQDKLSSQGSTRLKAYAKAYTPETTVYGNLGYNLDVNNFYGFDPGIAVEKDSINKNINSYFLNGGLKSADAEAVFQYDLGIGFSGVSDNFDASETIFSAKGGIAYVLNEESKIALDAELDFITQKGLTIDEKRNLIQLSPYYDFELAEFRVKLGLNAAISNDTLNSLDKFHVYPNIKVSYPVSDNLLVYAGLNGNIEKQTYSQLLENNPFLNDDIRVFHANKTFEFNAGLNARLSEKMAIDLGTSISSVKNMAFYINSMDRPEKFDVVYDQGNTTVSNFFGEFGFSEGKNGKVAVRGDFWSYGTSEIPEAYHKPTYKLTVLGKVGIVDKINLSINAYVLGGIKALDPLTQETLNLDPAFDLNAMLEYKVSKQFAAFLSFENLFNKNYELLYRYPVKGIQVMGGISYAF